ncbi:unnamed protein product [Paramecium primaurelia]|uniref:proline--tRNA ligase n=1 Tax=Paramecium primaurelia TaxID=5886 RepID=A0A8S1K418_PARPR|nr:unnamed protein product [Paramecium primaurelia]
MWKSRKIIYKILIENNLLLPNKQACLNQLTKLGINYIAHHHDPVPTMDDVIKIKVTTGTAYVKNLLYVDKKSNYYLILANHTTQVGKLFWKTLGLSSGNMRLSKEEQILEALKSSKGNINPFAIVNDSNNRVKNIIIDEELTKFQRVALHPIENTTTVEISLDDLQNKFLKPLNRQYTIIKLTDAEAEQQLQQLKQQSNDQQNLQTLAITVKKSDFSEWYQQVIRKAELIEYYDVSGCYILRPWGYFIWEQIQRYFDDLIRTEDVENSYFPMFISAKHLNKEKEHVEGFKAEVAWVTKYGESDLNEPLAIRPTSETIMYPAFAKWVQSHRDLPLKVNQWTNIVRWEFKFPTPFIRTREFLWQEGHTAHSTKEEAIKQVYTILDFYEQVYGELLAVPVIKGIKTESEKFAGGDFTTTVETIIPQNGRGLQGATSHHLGQNFSKMFEINFEDDKKQKAFAWQTSWGLTTRSIGAMIMFHGDDKGLVLPPRIAKYQIVIIPIIHKDLDEKQLNERCEQIKQILIKQKLRVHLDNRDNYSPGWKFNKWEQKGVPIRLEIGPGEFKNNEVRVVQRFDNKKYQIKIEEINKLNQILDNIHNAMFEKAKIELNQRIKQADNWKEFMIQLNQRNTILTKWCERQECEQQVKGKSGMESKEKDSEINGQVQLTGSAKTLCMPLKQDEIKEGEKCFHCGQQAKRYVLWGRSY